MKKVLACLLLLLSADLSLMASDVIDLGVFEVEGELRRPNIEYVSTNKKFEIVVGETLIMNFEELESNLTTIDLDELRSYLNDKDKI